MQQDDKEADPYATLADLRDQRARLLEMLGDHGQDGLPVQVNVVDASGTTRRGIWMVRSEIRPDFAYTPSQVKQFDDVNRYNIETGLFGSITMDERLRYTALISHVDSQIAEMERAQRTAERPTPRQDELEKCWLLWRAVRLHESQVKAALEELLCIRVTTGTEVSVRDEKLTARRTEYAQVRSRMTWLDSKVSVEDRRAIDIRCTIEEMARARAGNMRPDYDELGRRDAEIKAANHEIDVHVAGEVHHPSNDQVIPKRLPAQRAQELAILGRLAVLKIDPLAYPSSPAGKECPVKSDLQRELRYSVNVVEKALGRLRADGRLRNT